MANQQNSIKTKRQRDVAIEIQETKRLAEAYRKVDRKRKSDNRDGDERGTASERHRAGAVRAT